MATSIQPIDASMTTKAPLPTPPVLSTRAPRLACSSSPAAVTSRPWPSASTVTSGRCLAQAPTMSGTVSHRSLEHFAMRRPPMLSGICNTARNEWSARPGRHLTRRAGLMHINVLTQCIPAPFFEGMWRHPDDGTAVGYRSLEYWMRMAHQLESACIDALFFADRSEEHTSELQSLRHLVCR